MWFAVSCPRLPRSRPAAIASAVRLVEGLNAAGIEIAMPAEDLTSLSPHLAARVTELTRRNDRAAPAAELMIVLGGDGTILRGAEWVMASDTPLLGVNLGHVGFLAEAESSEIDSIVERVVDRSYRVEERFTIDLQVRNGNDVIWSSFAGGSSFSSSSLSSSQSYLRCCGPSLR